MDRGRLRSPRYAALSMAPQPLAAHLSFRAAPPCGGTTDQQQSRQQKQQKSPPPPPPLPLPDARKNAAPQGRAQRQPHAGGSSDSSSRKSSNSGGGVRGGGKPQQKHATQARTMASLAESPATTSPSHGGGAAAAGGMGAAAAGVAGTHTAAATAAVVDRQIPLAQFTAGALAGLVNVIVLSPLEVVKVRLQAQSRAMSPSAVAFPPRYNGMVHALRVMLREEGWRSYYRGINASLWAFIPNWAIYWFSYEAFKRRLTPAHARSATPLTHVTAALGAGALTAVATAPLWTLKSRLQTDIAVGARRRYTAVWSGLRKIAADEGFFALYKGLTPTLLGLGHVMLQFPVYEHIKAKLSNNREEDLRPAHILVASSLSKILASAVFYGHEVIRVRIQLDSRVRPGVSEPVRMARLARDVIRTEGVQGLYRGFGTNLVRTVPACMLTFTSYELAKRFVLENQHFLKSSSTKPSIKDDG